MTLRGPSLRQLRALGDEFGFSFDDAELQEIRSVAGELTASYDVVDRLDPPTLPVEYARRAGTRPADNPYNAWTYRCRVAGAAEGPLAGKTVALKDTIALAGVPLSNGFRGLASYVPDEDATVVTRLLDAGATIVGKATCESLSLSSGSHTSDTGPVRNVHNPDYSAGGSSSGCGVLVAAGEVDIAIGGDQGGSVRVPAAWSGVYGHKPTHGLVPYTGAMPFEPTVDHLGPITRTPADLAVAMDVVAGWDGLDPRGSAAVRPERYSAALGVDVSDVRVGVLSEGFADAAPEVASIVRLAVDRLGSLGCAITEVSVPMHADGTSLALPIYAEGGVVHGVHHNRGAVLGVDGHNLLGLVDRFGHALRTNVDDLPPVATIFSLLGEHMQRAYHGRYYVKAQNLRRTLRAAYDAVFEQVDVLAMPTTPIAPTRLPGPDAPLAELVARALDMTSNAVPFNLTGHPATSVPAGTTDGLPVGLMLVAPKGRDARLLSLAFALGR